MNKFVIVVVPDEKKAYEYVHALEALDKDGSVTVYATAVVQREANGSLSVKHRSDVGPIGTALGSLIGALIGIFGGPVGVLAGTAAGGLVGTVGQYGVHEEVSEEFAEDVTRELRPGQCAVLAELEEEWASPIETQLGQLGGKVICESRQAVVEDLFHKRVDARKAELERFKRDRATAKAERMESAIEREIQSTAEKIRRSAEKAQSRLEERKEEMLAKIRRLEDQASNAKPEVKSRIQHRIEGVRQDFYERSEKLQRAYEMTQEALRA